VKKIKLILLLVLVTVLVSGLAVSLYAATNPSRSQIYEEMKAVGEKYDIPPEVLYAVGYTESDLQQYDDSGGPLISPDGGIGIMQVTPGHITQSFDTYDLKYDWRYNVDAGAQVLLKKWNYKNKIDTIGGQTGSFIPIIGDGDPMVLENWYFALWAYNGYVGENNPNELPKEINYVGSGYTKYKGYQEKVIENANYLGYSITELPASWLPDFGVPPAGSRYETPEPIHYSEIDDGSYEQKPDINLISNGLYATSFANFPEVNLIAHVINRGEEAVDGSFTLTLYNNGNTIQKTVDGLAAGKTKQVTFDSGIDATGEYNYSVLIDSSNQITEKNETDNKLKGRVKVTNDGYQKVETPVDTSPGGDKARNLSVMALEVLGKVDSSGTYNVAAQIKNTGNVPIDKKTDATLYMNDKTFRTTVSSMDIGEEKVVLFSTDITQGDIYNYSVVADSTAKIAEENELDNKLTGTADLSEVGYTNPDSDLTVTFPEEIVANSKSEFRGQTPDNTETVIALVDGYKLCEISPNQDGTYDFDYTFLNAGLNRNLVIKAFNIDGDLIEKVETKLNVLSPEQLSLELPKVIKEGESIEIKGQAMNPIHKVIISVDGYKLTAPKGSDQDDVYVVDGEYSMNYTFDSANDSRNMVVHAFDENGNSVKQIEREITVHPDQALTVDYPSEIVVDNTVTISGQAPPDADKVIISVDGWPLTDANDHKDIKVADDNTYELNYAFDTAKDNRELVVKAFDINGAAVGEISEQIDVVTDVGTSPAPDSLTVDYPGEVEVDKEITISGEAPAEAYKVIVSVDGYPLTNQETDSTDIMVNNGQYSLDCILNSAGDDRNLVVKAFDENGYSLGEIERKITVTSDHIELDVPYYYQLNNSNDPYGTCNITNLAMALSYNTQTIDPDTIYNYEGSPVYTGTDLRRLARHYGATNSVYHAGVGKEKVKYYLDRGIPVIFQGQFTGGRGHMILLVGYDDTGWIVNDPFGEWFSSGYKNTSTAGDGVHYSYDLVDNNSLGGWNNYYITAVY